MSQAIIMAQKPAIDSTFGMLGKFIEACPDDVWAETHGGWPVWQQLYHAINTVAFFTGLPSALPPLADQAVASLERPAGFTASKTAVRAALTEAEALVGKYLAGLSDDDLPKRNEPVFAAAQWPITHATTLGFLSGHGLYHLGSLDAALRDRGFKGVF